MKRPQSFTLDDPEIALLEEMSKAAQRSKSDIIRRAIKKYYDFFEKEWHIEK
jgi:predicted transcriptional regulator